MSEWNSEFDGGQSLEAFTLGGGLAKEAPVAGAPAPKSPGQTERPRRRTPVSRRRPTQFRYSNPSQRRQQPRNVLARTALAADAVLAPKTKTAKLPPAGKMSWLGSLRATRDFSTLFKRAMQAKPGSPPVESIDGKSGVRQIKSQASQEPTKQEPTKDERAQSRSIRIVLPGRAALHLETILKTLGSALTWAQAQLKSRQRRKRLRVCETVSLGEKRFVAVIEIDGEQFLLGGASNSVAAIARLEPAPQISEEPYAHRAKDPAVQA